MMKKIMKRKMRTKKMTGNHQEGVMSFYHLYQQQEQFQSRVVGGASLPQDNTQQFMYHMASLQEEIGEVLKADKRWKTHRNNQHDQDEKLDEIADCFIIMMNIAMWSGIDYKQLGDAINNKIATNNERLNKHLGDK